ncbi:hypothetical protein H0H92_013124 [Tricholoma furcatifolium]|nr:hypothetical protein H0H92_013124 [Tricholoma furcatifolium]
MTTLAIGNGTPPARGDAGPAIDPNPEDGWRGLDDGRAPAPRVGSPTLHRDPTRGPEPHHIDPHNHQGQGANVHTGRDEDHQRPPPATTTQPGGAP